MKNFIYFLLFLLVAAQIQGEEILEGNAAVIRRGEFDSQGLFAASNSFPKNSKIMVENQQTGKQIQVTVIKRIEDSGNLFILLSEQAADALGLNSSEVIRVKTKIIACADLENLGIPGDLAYSPDPDINPSANAPDVQMEEPVVEEPAAEAEEEPETEEETEAEETAAEEVATESVVKDTPDPAEKRLQEVSSRIPQKQLYMPPREDERFTYTEPEETEETIETETEEEPIEQVETPTEPSALSMASPQEESTKVDVTLPGPKEPEPPRAQGRHVLKPEPETCEVQPDLPLYKEDEEKAEAATLEVIPSEDVVITLKPTEPQPPPEEETAAEETASPVKEIPYTEKLSKGSYFVQLGAYSTRTVAENLASDLESTYTVAIQPGRFKDRLIYKVLVGPLNRDESGTLLHNFKFIGFKDAFIKHVD